MSEGTPAPKRPEDFIHLDFQEPGWQWEKKKRPLSVSVLVHLAVFTLLAVPITRNAIVGEAVPPHELLIRFYEKGAKGPGGGGGGGGSGGRKPTAYIRARFEAPEPEQPSKPREAPIAPRKLPPLVFGDTLQVPDLPTDTELLFGSVFSPDAVDSPGLSFDVGADLGGIDREPSSGTGGGIGGGKGTGVGPGEGWGVGPGRGGGFGGGDYKPGGYDIEPVVVYKVDPEYPPKAVERSVRGEVILKILVRKDGSTEVLGVLKSLPYGCVEAAVRAANQWRFKPALKDGEPVEVVGIIEVEFDLLASGRRKG